MNTKLLLDPPFAADPPVKLNINAKVLGLVLAILGGIDLIFAIIALFSIFGFCGSYGYLVGCGLPILWLLGEIIQIVGLAIGTTGAYRMYQLNPQGKEWVVYGLVLGFIGAIVDAIGTLAAYSGVIGYGAGGVVAGIIISFIFYFILYYLVVISRFPGQAPLVASGPTSWGSPPPSVPPSSPPPPPPSA